MVAAKRGIKSKIQSGGKTRVVFVFISLVQLRAVLSLSITGVPMYQKTNREKIQELELERERRDGAHRVRLLSAALRRGIQRSPETWRKCPPLLPPPLLSLSPPAHCSAGRAQNSARKKKDARWIVLSPQQQQQQEKQQQPGRF